MKKLKKFINLIPLQIVLFALTVLFLIFSGCLFFVRYQMYNTLNEDNNKQIYKYNTFIFYLRIDNIFSS